MSDVFHVLGVPAGRKLTITIPATAGNVTTNISPGVGKRYLLMRGRITLQNNATVANRQVILAITDGTNISEYLLVGANVAASAAWNISMGEVNLAPSTGALGDSSGGYLGLGNGIVLHGVDQFRITISAGVAGDSYSGFLDFLEVDA